MFGERGVQMLEESVYECLERRVCGGLRGVCDF